MLLHSICEIRMRHIRGNIGPLVISVSIIGLLSPTPASMYTAQIMPSSIFHFKYQKRFMNFKMVTHYVRHAHCRISLALDFHQTLKIGPYCKRGLIARVQISKNVPYPSEFDKYLNSILKLSIDNFRFLRTVRNNRKINLFNKQKKKIFT